MLNYLPDISRYWLMGLWLLWAILLFGGFIFGRESETHRIPVRARMGSSAALALAGWSWFLISPDNAARPYALFIAIGMSSGFAGDLALSGLFPSGRNVMGGMAAFGLGHVFYIAAILRYSIQTGLNDPAARWGTLIVWLIIAAIAWYFVVFRGQAAGKLRWAALPYALLLAATAGFAAGLALQSSRFIGLAIGAALFLFSDLVLAGELFGGLKFKSIGDVVWLAYGPGQMLIVYSVSAAIRFLF